MAECLTLAHAQAIIRHVFSGSAQGTLDILKDILEDLDLVQAKLESAIVLSKIIIKLKKNPCQIRETFQSIT